MSLRDYLARYKSILAYNNMIKVERSDYGDECCGSDDSKIVLIGLLLLVTALLAYLLLTATVSSGRRRKRELNSLSMDSTSFASNCLKHFLVIDLRKWSAYQENIRAFS